MTGDYKLLRKKLQYVCGTSASHSVSSLCLQTSSPAGYGVSGSASTAGLHARPVWLSGVSDHLQMAGLWAGPIGPSTQHSTALHQHAPLHRQRGLPAAAPGPGESLTPQLETKQMTPRCSNVYTISVSVSSLRG